MARIQFILKRREMPFVGETTTDGEGKPLLLSSGLLNSASFVVNALRDAGHTVEISHAIDNNCIDRLVTKFRPDIAVIEAYWVVPDKFDILSKLHKNVTWVIRNHSATPFLANEGVVMDWSLRYMDYPNVVLACNDHRTDREFADLVRVRHPEWTEAELRRRVVLLSNIYPATYKPRVQPEKDVLDIGCFGALRPLKNQLAQAVAAIRYAQKVGKHLRFHVNGTRIEMKGQPIVHNLQKMFAQLPYELVEHEWLPHEQFCALLRTMDVAMQVSYTETFNIVCADALVNGVPIITSNDILWSDPKFQADPNDTDNMMEVISYAYESMKQDTYWQRSLQGLKDFSDGSQKLWLDFIQSVTLKE